MAEQRPKQHWIPAVVLAGFSADSDRPRPRDRRLQVRYRDRPRPQVTSAKALAYIRGLYDWDEDDPSQADIDTLDDTFNSYERKLPAAFAEITDSTGLVRLDPWLRTLVPYAAGICVRSPFFLADAAGESVNLLMQRSRWMEMARSVAPLMAADWAMLTAPAGARFVLNDRGFTPAVDETGSHGLVLPITGQRALMIMPRSERIIGWRDQDQTWWTTLHRVDLDAQTVAGLNSTTARAAVDWFAGAQPEDVLDGVFGDRHPDVPAIGGNGWPDRGPLGSHDQDWSAAVRYAGLQLGLDDWHPFAILSGIEPGVRPIVTEQGPAIQISFRRPQRQ